MKEELEGIALMVFVIVMIGLLSFCIGIGYLLGAGAGWLAFAVLCILFAIATIKLYKDKAKAEQEAE